MANKTPKLKKSGSFGEFVRRHKVKVVFVYVFFAGFLLTGLVYAVVTGNFSVFGSTNYTPGVSLKFTQADVHSSHPNDAATIHADGQTMAFHLSFDDTNTPKSVTFCIENTTAMRFRLEAPTTAGPTDQNVRVVWPAMQGIEIEPYANKCDAVVFRIEVWYAAESPSDLTADMSMRINYVQV